jgi:hypothetical protein
MVPNRIGGKVMRISRYLGNALIGSVKSTPEIMSPSPAMKPAMLAKTKISRVCRSNLQAARNRVSSFVMKNLIIFEAGL